MKSPPNGTLEREAFRAKENARKRAWRASRTDAKREADRAASRQWHHQNRDLAIEKMKAWRDANPTASAESSRAWREANPDRQIALSRAWKANNVDRLREYVDQTRERKNAQQRERLRANPEIGRAAAAKRRAAIANASGRFNRNDIATIMRLQRRLCAVCRCRLDAGYEIDHIEPLARGGSNDRTNLQLLCPTCNRSKGAKHPIDFMQSRGFLL